LSSSEAKTLNEHLAQCESCQDKMDEAAFRVLWSDANATDVEAHVKLVDPVTSTAAGSPARILYLSKTGMMVKMSRRVEYKMLLQIRYEKKYALTEVRYCRSVGSDFHVGVRILEDFAQQTAQRD
jgi:hypothetical protein